MFAFIGKKTAIDKITLILSDGENNLRCTSKCRLQILSLAVPLRNGIYGSVMGAKSIGIIWSLKYWLVLKLMSEIKFNQRFRLG